MTGLGTCLGYVASLKECVQKLRCDERFTKVWGKATAAADALPRSTTPKPRRTANKKMDNYLVEETTNQREDDIEKAL